MRPGCGVRTGGSGFTLVEILITVCILSVGILSALMFYTSASRSTRLSQDMTVAVTDAGSVLEEMVSRPSLADITATDWTAWAAASGLNTLPSQTLAVVYANPAADPLHIEVTVNWIRNVRAHHVTLVTEMTK